MKWIAIILLAAGLGVGCETDHRSSAASLRFGSATDPRQTVADWRAKLHAVNLTHGVSEADAKIIAQCYFAKHVGCGVFDDVRDGGDRWIIEGGFGYAGLPVKGTYILKNSGKFVSIIGPGYDNPLEILP